MIRALVTGGCGFIGSNLVDKLIELEYDVTVARKHKLPRKIFIW